MMQPLSHSSAKQQRRLCRFNISSSRTYALPRSGIYGDVECIFFSGSRLRQNIPAGEYIITDMDVTAGSSLCTQKGRSCDNLRRYPHYRKYGDRRCDPVHNSGDPQKMASGSFLYIKIRSRMYHVRVVLPYSVRTFRCSCKDSVRGMFRSAAVSCGVRET